jgi:hypothetical protein
VLFPGVFAADKSKRRFSFMNRQRPGRPGSTDAVGKPANPIGVRAADMRMTDEERIAVMELVRAGQMTVEEAIAQVMEKEAALASQAKEAAQASEPAEPSSPEAAK